jgi:hypothetical protein
VNDGSHDLLVGGLVPEASMMSSVGYLECPSRTDNLAGASVNITHES